MFINDIHIGAARKAGTTPATQEALRAFVFQQFEQLLTGKHVIIGGDLFDRFEVEPFDLIRTYSIIAAHLAEPEAVLTLIAGNHDWNPRGSKVSSFHVLCHFLKAAFPTQVQVIDHNLGFTAVDERIYAIPHMPNQDLFNLEIDKAVEEGGRGRTLLLHANFENEFAEHADHSLNVFEAQTDRLLTAGWNLVFAHEHQHRLARDGRVVIVGNQIPTSVADCLGPDTKYALDDDLNLVPVLKMDDVFVVVDWRELDAVPDRAFIRVEGHATAEEASDVVNAIATLRQKSQAFVITNAVKVDGLAQFDKLVEMTFEEVTSFKVLDALLEELTPQEGVVVKELLNA